MAEEMFVEIKTLEYFVKVACEGNMSRAAEKLFVTQPNETTRNYVFARWSLD